ncbi:response regulator transcription factor [Clostridium estertheticum]|uniref:Stage 0 sporulation protein A homolog n=2 Tax=Clostridium estertheticum TaxID=238834 RepID=A0A5N7IJH5_9CLOT|nr:response regulator transcription factor [Clostridium estertheticum]MCB2308391.1 response regulator transcription factor [Clostridium estertheticum]MCB2338969.1 response regulator transcription factor [Clostridium estertheticum]MCB2346415.1 response regulator transcription factor [Clostridium estertheticum]MCB2349383.1 response regulator transcription factor [Clostridium estertheticum]MPQ30452.1 response regulator transcription factor [Clostridium estertheticum]
MYKILVIEDDIRLNKLVTEHLQKYRYDVTDIQDFKNVEVELDISKADLILLDINLPYSDGFQLCKTFRRTSKIPVIIISSRDSGEEQIRGLELGADDYITKPFNFDFLLAKIQAAIRRVYGEYANESTIIESMGGIKLNKDTFKIYYNGIELELSKNEFKLLSILIKNENRIVSREYLLEELWDDTNFVDDNTLTVNIARIRTKLKEFGVSEVISTKWGIGYMFQCDSEQEG